MASNYTSNYGLCQWVRTDKVLMDDFNADNAKLDAALAEKASASALTSLKSTVSTLQTTVNGLSSSKAEQTALNALAQTLGQHTTSISKLGNCAVHYATYQGDGAATRTHTFAHRPVFAIVVDANNSFRFMPVVHGAEHGFYFAVSAVELVGVSWGEKSITIDNYPSVGYNGLNLVNHTYHMVTFLDAEN